MNVCLRLPLFALPAILKSDKLLKDKQMVMAYLWVFGVVWSRGAKCAENIERRIDQFFALSPASRQISRRSAGSVVL